MSRGDKYKRLAPGFIRFNYSGFFKPHDEIIPIKFAGTPTPGVEPELETKSGGTISFFAGLADWADAFKLVFNADTKFGIAQIYSVDEDTGEATFIYAGNVVATGTSSDPNLETTQAVWRFKTVGGGQLLVTAMEGIFVPDSHNVGSVPADERQDIIDYILSDDSIFYGRDNSFPLAFLSFTSKVNDKLRKRQGLNNL